MSHKMDIDIETDACAEAGGATGGRVLGPPNSGAVKAETHIDFTTPDGSKFVVKTSGAAPNMQVGNYNVMHVVDNTSVTRSLVPTTKKTRHSIPHKLPLITSTEVPGGDAMDIVAKNIGKDWKALGRKLGLEDGELDNIKIDHYHEGQYEVTYQMIRKWKELAYPTELCKLAKACYKIGRGDISDKLAKNLNAS